MAMLNQQYISQLIRQQSSMSQGNCDNPFYNLGYGVSASPVVRPANPEQPKDDPVLLLLED